MKFKKLLGIISIVIVVVFSMMLTTSYAWYAFDNASTVFEGMTNNDDIIVSYQKGEYINVDGAIPITQEQVDKYSAKNNFNIKVKNNVKDNEMLVSISLVKITIDSSLWKNSFKVELYYQNKKVADIGGDSMTSETKKLADVVLDNDITNNFELRVYILDDGDEQGYIDRNKNGIYDRDATGENSEHSMMNCTFQAKIQVDVISRLKNTLNEYNNADINISSVTIDGEASDHIPTEGYYSMSSSCTKAGENSLEWDPLSKTITYSGGSYINDNCSLTFTSSTDYPLLSEMEPGSYVKYTGTNGCDGIHCEGNNANYVSDTDMGYCNTSSYKFYVNGWRLAYVENSNPYLVSAGSTDCMCTAADGTSSSSSCSNYLSAANLEKHFDNMNVIALKYCNKDYAKGGVCDVTTSWAMNAVDFTKITNNDLNNSSCYQKYSNMSCGYTNDLIDNGGYYWFATSVDASSAITFNWDPRDRYVDYYYSRIVNGVRPVLALESSIRVMGGKGTYKEPYIISRGDS